MENITELADYILDMAKKKAKNQNSLDIVSELYIIRRDLVRELRLIENKLMAEG